GVAPLPLRDRVLAAVVRRESLRGGTAVAGEELGEQRDADVDVGRDVVERGRLGRAPAVAAAYPARRRREQLHQAERTGGRHGVRLEETLLPDHGRHQERVDATCAGGARDRVPVPEGVEI